MELKVLTEHERKAVTELFFGVFSDEPWNDDWSDRTQLDAYIDDLTGQRNSLTLGLLDDGRLVGLAMGRIKHWYGGTEYSIDEFCIEKQSQNKGVGSLFLKGIEADLLQNGITHIFLETEKTVPAYPFYLRRGFRELPSHVGLVKKIEG